LFSQAVACVLMSVAVYGRASSLVTDLPIVGGILACGIILFGVSIVGLVGALRHHQVLLFFVSFRKFTLRSTYNAYFLFYLTLKGLNTKLGIKKIYKFLTQIFISNLK